MKNLAGDQRLKSELSASQSSPAGNTLESLLGVPITQPDPGKIASQAEYVGDRERVAQDFLETLATECLPQVRGQRWVLTPHEYKLADQARTFMEQRYRELGIDALPETYGPFFYNDDFSPASGTAKVTERWFGIVEAGPGRWRSDDHTAALMVHEQTHAIGSVRLTERAIKTDTPFLSGVKMSARVGQNYAPMFTALEEYVACGNQRIFLRSLGYSEIQISTECMHDLNPDSRLDVAILRAAAEIHLPPEDLALLEEEAQTYENGWSEMAKANNLSVVRVPLPLLKYEMMVKNGFDEIVDIYGANNIVLDKLSAEIFPELPWDQRSKAFRDAATVAHATGDYKALFSRIKATIGVSGLKMLAFARPDLDRLPDTEGIYTTHVTSLLLALYADAGALIPERRARVREMLAQVIDPRKAP